MLILVTDEQFSGVSTDVATLVVPFLQKHGIQTKGDTENKEREAEMQKSWKCWY